MTDSSDFEYGDLFSLDKLDFDDDDFLMGSSEEDGGSSDEQFLDNMFVDESKLPDHQLGFDVDFLNEEKEKSPTAEPPRGSRRRFNHHQNHHVLLLKNQQSQSWSLKTMKKGACLSRLKMTILRPSNRRNCFGERGTIQEQGTMLPIASTTFRFTPPSEPRHGQRTKFYFG